MKKKKKKIPFLSLSLPFLFTLQHTNYLIHVFKHFLPLTSIPSTSFIPTNLNMSEVAEPDAPVPEPIDSAPTNEAVVNPPTKVKEETPVTSNTKNSNGKHADNDENDDRASTETAEDVPMEVDAKAAAEAAVDADDASSIPYEDYFKMFTLAKNIIDEEFETAYKDVAVPTTNNFQELKAFVDVGLDHFAGADAYFLDKESFDFGLDVNNFPPSRTVSEYELFFRVLDVCFINKLKKAKLLPKLTERLKIHFKVKSLNVSMTHIVPYLRGRDPVTIMTEIDDKLSQFWSDFDQKPSARHVIDVMIKEKARLDHSQDEVDEFLNTLPFEYKMFYRVLETYKEPLKRYVQLLANEYLKWVKYKKGYNLIGYEKVKTKVDFPDKQFPQSTFGVNKLDITQALASTNETMNSQYFEAVSKLIEENKKNQRHYNNYNGHQQSNSGGRGGRGGDRGGRGGARGSDRGGRGGARGSDRGGRGGGRGGASGQNNNNNNNNRGNNSYRNDAPSDEYKPEETRKRVRDETVPPPPPPAAKRANINPERVSLVATPSAPAAAAAASGDVDGFLNNMGITADGTIDSSVRAQAGTAQANSPPAGGGFGRTLPKEAAAIPHPPPPAHRAGGGRDRRDSNASAQSPHQGGQRNSQYGSQQEFHNSYRDSRRDSGGDRGGYSERGGDRGGYSERGGDRGGYSERGGDRGGYSDRGGDRGGNSNRGGSYHGGNQNRGGSGRGGGNSRGGRGGRGGGGRHY